MRLGRALRARGLPNPDPVHADPCQLGDDPLDRPRVAIRTIVDVLRQVAGAVGEGMHARVELRQLLLDRERRLEVRRHVGGVFNSWPRLALLVLEPQQQRNRALDGLLVRGVYPEVLQAVADR
eukprot:9504116-Pyramimonas_sp.AAC.3